jgi:ribosome-associated translation inhibitor RaiA
MQIQVNTDSNIEAHEGMVSRVQDETAAALARFSDRLTRVEVHLGDESARRSTGPDKRCVLEARLAGQEPVSVTDHAETVEDALGGALDKMVRLLEHWSGREQRSGRDSIRRNP